MMQHRRWHFLAKLFQMPESVIFRTLKMVLVKGGVQNLSAEAWYGV
jgi:hypothetical protein